MAKRQGHPRLPLYVFTAFALSAPGSIWAQTAILQGTVTDAENKESLLGVSVVVTAPDLHPTVATTDASGNYRVQNLAPGTYTVSVSFAGYEKKVVTVIVAAGESKILNIEVTPSGLSLNPVVVSVSRRPEKILEAPAAVSVLEGTQIRGRPAITPTDYLRGLPAVYISAIGIAQSNVTVRGFNNIFSGALLTLVDDRYAGIPSLQLNAYNFIPTTIEDIARIEVVSGPVSALYGPNSTGGVIHLITRSSFESEGTSISIGGGGRDFFNFARHDDLTPNDFNHPNGRIGGRNIYLASFRHARIFSEKAAFKISGQYYRGRDWEDYYGFVGLPDSIPRFRLTPTGVDMVQALAPNYPDFNVEKIAGEARLDFRLSNDATLIFSGGYNRSNNLDLTGIGPVQAKDWIYTYAQTRFFYKDLFIQGFMNRSNADDTYSLLSGVLIVDNPKLFVGQIQHGARLGSWQRFTYGVDANFTRPTTINTIYGRNEEDNGINEYGVYLQSETKLNSNFAVLLAARMDDHNRAKDPVFSSRAALMFKPNPVHNFRVTYNRASNPRLTPDLFLDIIVSRNTLIPTIRRTTLVSDDIDTPPSDIAPIKETIMHAFELGYKGISNEKLVLGVDVYHVNIKNFIRPLRLETPVVFPYSATSSLPTFHSFGEVSMNGMDVTLTYYPAPNWRFAGNYFFVTQNGFNIFKRPNRVVFRNVDNIGSDIALNAPGNKVALSIQYRAPQRGYDAELRGRYIEGFPQDSDGYLGEVQTYTVFDFNFGYDLPFLKGTRWSINALNIFDKKHLEFIGAPILGRLIMTRLTQSF